MKRRQEQYPAKRRSQARMLVLQALCAFEAVGGQFSEQLDYFLRDECALADLEIELPLSDELLRFARSLALGAWAQREVLNDQLSRTATHWSLARMTPVDRNVLRLGLYELREHPETPPEVVINEAIELARRFGDADSPAFVNGVLDAIWRSTVEATDARKDDSADSQTNNKTDDVDGLA